MGLTHVECLTMRRKRERRSGRKRRSNSCLRLKANDALFKIAVGLYRRWIMNHRTIGIRRWIGIQVDIRYSFFDLTVHSLTQLVAGRPRRRCCRRGHDRITRPPCSRSVIEHVGRPVIRKVSKIRIWVVPPVCLGRR